MLLETLRAYLLSRPGAAEDHPFGLNIFECPNPQSNAAVQKIVDLVMHIFEKLYDVSRQTPRMAQFLRNCTHTLVANPGYTMAEIPLLLENDEFRNLLVSRLSSRHVKNYWLNKYNRLSQKDQLEERAIFSNVARSKIAGISIVKREVSRKACDVETLGRQARHGAPRAGEERGAVRAKLGDRGREQIDRVTVEG